MVVIFGTRLLGETDAVPGVFYVATKFFHIDFLPLIPLSTYIVLKRRFRSFQGIEIPLSGKSIAVAWLRAIGMIGVFITGIWSILIFSDEGLSAAFLALFGAFLIASLVASFLFCHGYTRNASYERACELASKLGPVAGPVVQRHVDAHFGKVAFVAVSAEDDDDDNQIASLETQSREPISKEVLEFSALGDAGGGENQEKNKQAIEKKSTVAESKTHLLDVV